MPYLEMFVNLCNEHKQLQILMKKDSNSKIQDLARLMFPTEQEEEELEKIPVRVKNEKDVPEVTRHQLEEDNQDDPDDPDDPPPAPVPAPAKRAPVRGSAPARNATPVVRKTAAGSVPASQGPVRPRVERIMNCFICRNLKPNENIKYHFAGCVYLEVKSLLFCSQIFSNVIQHCHGFPNFSLKKFIFH